MPVKSLWKKRRRHDFRGVTRSVRTAAVNSRCSRQKFECSSLNCNLMAPPRRPPISKQTADCFPCLSGDAMRAISLRSVSTTLAALVLSCSTSLAQIAPLTVISPAMGATSPLGIPGALTGVTSPVGPVGIPLGASELSPGGLSPAPLDPTASTNSCSSSVGNGSSSTFDGAGVSTSTTASCSVGASTGTASGTLPTSSLDGATGSTVSAGTIPLGATELDSGGLSPLVAPPTFGSSCVVGSPTTMTAAILGSTIAGGTTSLTGSAPIGLSSGC